VNVPFAFTVVFPRDVIFECSSKLASVPGWNPLPVRVIVPPSAIVLGLTSKVGGRGAAVVVGGIVVGAPMVVGVAVVVVVAVEIGRKTSTEGFAVVAVTITGGIGAIGAIEEEVVVGLPAPGEDVVVANVAIVEVVELVVVVVDDDVVKVVTHGPHFGTESSAGLFDTLIVGSAEAEVDSGAKSTA
jgi:hypothetical protein